MTKKELREIDIEVLAPNQVIVKTKIGTKFVSYGSNICTKFADDKVEIYPDWDHSRTTSKYRAMFLGETTKETQAKINSGEYKLKGY